jgi:hypothetical protein
MACGLARCHSISAWVCASSRFGVAQGDFGGRHRHRRIDHHLQVAQAAAPHQVREDENHFLRAADGKGRHDDVAALAPQRAVDRLDQLLLGRLERLVQAVAVGRFDQQHVGLLDRLRIVQHRPRRHADIAREHQLARGAALFQPHLGDGRAEDVAGIAQAHPHGRMGLEGPVVFGAAQLLQAGLRLRHGVEQAGVTQAAAPAARPARQPLGFLLLDVRRIEQHHAEQVRRGRGDMHRAAEAERDGARQQPGMVEVGMREQHEVEPAQVEAERREVAAAGVAAALEQAAVDKKAHVRRLDQVAGAGHLAGGAVECDSHDFIVLPQARYHA